MFPEGDFVRSHGGDATYKSVLTGLLLPSTALERSERPRARVMGFASIERQGSIVRAFVLTFGVRADLYDCVVVVAFFKET